MTWPSVPLRDILATPLANGRSVPSRAGGFPVLRLTALRNGAIDLSERKEGAWTQEDAQRFLVREGDFLVSRGNGSLSLVGRGGLVEADPEPVAFPDTMIRVRPDRQRVEPRYLAHAWGSPAVRAQIERSARTTAGIYKINQAHLGSVAVPVPPLGEQRRVVEILEDHLSHLDAAEAGLFRSRMRLHHWQERLIVRSLTGEAEPGTRLPVDLVAAGANDGTLSELPCGWRWCRLAELADVVGGVTKDAKKQGDPSFLEVPYLRVANVQRARLNLSQITQIRVSPTKVEQLRLMPGDVLLNEGGDRDKLARGWVWEGQIENCVHQNHVFRARIRDGVDLDPRFLSWTANVFGGPWAERNGKQSVNLASISLKMIRQMPVILPPPGVSRRVADELSQSIEDSSRLASQIDISAKRASILRAALLSAAFSGRLTSTTSDDMEIA